VRSALEWYHDERCLKSADNRYSGERRLRSSVARVCPSIPCCIRISRSPPTRRPPTRATTTRIANAATEARQLQAALIASHTNGDCHRPPPLAADARTDVNLFANFAELLCACDACAAALRDAGLHFLLEEEPTESECEETVAPEDVPLADMVTSSTRDMSFEQQHLASAFASDFRAALSAVVANKEHGASSPRPTSQSSGDTWTRRWPRAAAGDCHRPSE
jgi:hypothetical protein